MKLNPKIVRNKDGTITVHGNNGTARFYPGYWKELRADFNKRLDENLLTAPLSRLRPYV